MYARPGWAPWFWSCFGAWMWLEVWVWWRERGGTKGEDRDRGSKRRLILWMWVGLDTGFALMFALPGGQPGWHPRALFALGMACLLFGVLLRFWAIRTLGRFFRSSVILQGEHRIISHGPYRFIRNPSYTGASLASIGLGLGMSNWYSLAVIVPCVFVAFWQRIQVEQQALTEHFGQDYRDYIARSWALVPFLW